MLIITGTGRCGTSLLAHFCKRMGYDPGGDWDPKTNSGFEDPEMVEINTAIHEGKCNQDIIRRLVAYHRPVVKDPRFVSLCGGPMLVWPLWRKDLKFILLYRDLTQACRSARENKMPTGQMLSQDIRGTIEDLQCFWTEVIQGSYLLRVLYFPAIIDDYPSVHEALVTFGGLNWDYEEGETEWRSLARHDMVHFK